MSLLEKVLGGLKSFILSDDEKTLLNNNVKVDSESHRKTLKGLEITKNRGDVTINIKNTYNFSAPNSKQQWDEVPGDEISELKTLIMEGFRSGELQAVYRPSIEMLDDYCEYERGARDDFNFDVLNGKITDNDLMIIRTGLYLRYLLTLGEYEKLKRVKNEAVRNDPRTRNILNLVTDGYFEKYVVPVFENEEPDKALAYYEEVVTYLPEIIFVHNDMSVDEIVEKVDIKIQQRERYHVAKVKQIIVNGIGRQCIQKIAEAQIRVMKNYVDYDVSLNTLSGALPRAQLQIKF